MALGWGRGLRDQRGAEPGAPGRLRALGRALFPVWKGSDGDEKGVGGPAPYVAVCGRSGGGCAGEYVRRPGLRRECGRHRCGGWGGVVLLAPERHTCAGAAIGPQLALAAPPQSEGWRWGRGYVPGERGREKKRF